MASAALSRESVAVSHMEATQTRITPHNQQPLRLLTLDDMPPMGMKEAVQETLKDHLTTDFTVHSVSRQTDVPNSGTIYEFNDIDAAPQTDDDNAPRTFGKLSPAENAAHARFQPRDFDAVKPSAMTERGKRDLWLASGLVAAVLAINLGLALASSEDTPAQAAAAAPITESMSAKIDTSNLPNADEMPMISPQPRADFANEKPIDLPPAPAVQTAAPVPAPSMPMPAAPSTPSYAAKSMYQPAPVAAPVHTASALPSRAAVNELLKILKQ